MRLPRLICTLGTTTDDASVLMGMAAHGMGMARLNTAYATLDELGARIDDLRAVCEVPVLLDLKGPQLRVDCTTERRDPATGRVVQRPCRYPIAAGELVYVGFQSGPVRFNWDFRDDLEPGALVTFANGTIRTRVADPEAEGIEPAADAVLLRILDAGDGHMTPQMGANVPGRALHVPSLSARDLRAVELGIAQQVEAYALSFVRRPGDLLHLHEVLVEHGDSDALLVAKIEEPLGIEHLEDIVTAGRGCGRRLAVMVARGDLFEELPPERLFAVQRDLVARCRALAVPSIVATGLLRSMVDSPRPSRAEVCDVAAALTDGADALMLSDETSNSRHPVEATATLARLIEEYGGRPCT